ncbi:transposase [Streptomyces hirsutus]|uniref:transposase n=1 Tax=Streptomyces hirsutus TaxID=35620 RepID=UPI00364715E6
MSGRGSGCISVAGLIALRPGCRTRLCYRIRVHHGRRSERRSLSETAYIRLVDGAHQLLKAPIVLVWDRLGTHASKAMQQLVAARS